MKSAALNTYSAASFVKIWILIILHCYMTLKFVGYQKGTCSFGFSNYKRNPVVFACKTKNYLLLALSGDGFSMYLAYFANIFKALNQLDKKLRDQEVT